MTTPHINNMKTPKPVFITSKKPFRGVHPAALGHWIKDSFNSAGVDTGRFTADLTRSASTYQARMQGVPVTDILKVANWTSRSTFEKFYHSPSDSSAFTRVVQSSKSFRYIRCFKSTTSKHCTMYLELPKYSLQIPRGRRPQGRMDCLRRWKIKGTVDFHPLFTVVLQVPSLLFTMTSQRRRRWTSASSCPGSFTLD